MAKESLKGVAPGDHVRAAAMRSGLVSLTAVSVRPLVARTARLCSWPIAP